MSATGRTPGVRVPFDDYATPTFCVDRLLEAAKLPGGSWLEPCAGTGGIIAAVNAKRSDVVWTAVEIQPKYEAALLAAPGDVKIGDFLELPFGERPFPPLFNVAILNPPYALAEEVIKKCQKLAGVTAALLRVNFLASSGRADWLRSWTPDVYVLPNRPSFVGGKTDSTEYCWAVWDWNRISDRAVLRILATTPKELRSRRKPAKTAAAAPEDACTCDHLDEEGICYCPPTCKTPCP